MEERTLKKLKCFALLTIFLFWIFSSGKIWAQVLPTVEFSLKEGSGPETAPLEVEVKLSEPSLTEVRVEYRVTGGTATGDGVDFSLPDGFLIFAPGETRKTIRGEIIDDTIKEEEETILITLANPVNATLGVNKTFTYTILDDDTVTVSFTSPTSSDFEHVSPASLEVKLSKPAEEIIMVNYTVSGTAKGGGVDYTLPNGTLIFRPGEISQKIAIDITDDSIQEPDKTIIVTLSLPEPANAKLGKFDRHTYWILDDDGPEENILLFKQEVDSFEEGKKLYIIGPKTLRVNPRGMAVDKFGNIYISDQGPSLAIKEGSILMWPKGKKRVIRIITGLTLPGDIELSPDQKMLIVAGPRGDIYKFPLGVSIRLTNVDASSGNTRIHLFGQMIGEKVARVSPDGYFHFLGLQIPGQPNQFYIDVEHAGKTKRFTISLGQPGEEGEPYGHTVLDLEF
jgi:hypothetical protein